MQRLAQEGPDWNSGVELSEWLCELNAGQGDPDSLPQSSGLAHLVATVSL